MIDAPAVAAAAFAPLGLLEHRTGRAVVGRPAELAAIEDAIGIAEGGRLSALTVEGEPGIGKTRLLLAARESAQARGFLTVAVGADEELRGPFLLARSIVGAPEVIEAAWSALLARWVGAWIQNGEQQAEQPSCAVRSGSIQSTDSANCPGG